MDPEDDSWDGRPDRDAFLANRVAHLAKALTDHTAWRRALDGAGGAGSLAVAWADHEGRRHDTAVDRAYIRTHLAIVRSLTADLSGRGRRRARRARRVRPSTRPDGPGEAG